MNCVQVKLPPARLAGRDVRTEARFAGPLSECLRRQRPADAVAFERRWYRAQMRGWAGHWRRARRDAAMVGKPVEEVASTVLQLAVIYRDSGRRVAGRKGGDRG